MEVYKILANLYLGLGLEDLALQMWEKFIKAGKERLFADADIVNFSDIMTQMKKLEQPKQDSNQNSKYMILANYKDLHSPSLSHLQIITWCEIADKWRITGYIKHAICFYTSLLEELTMSDDPKFNKMHSSRLHNNLAACYQDLNDDQTALHHYLLSLDILSPDEEEKSMHAAIIHYNIALICTNCNELNEARMHLHKSLLHLPRISENKDSALDVHIYIAFAKTYEQCNDWQMARDYYQRAIDQVKQDGSNYPNIAKYQKRLQYIIDKINEST